MVRNWCSPRHRHLSVASRGHWIQGCAGRGCRHHRRTRSWGAVSVDVGCHHADVVAHPFQARNGAGGGRRGRRALLWIPIRHSGGCSTRDRSPAAVRRVGPGDCGGKRPRARRNVGHRPRGGGRRGSRCTGGNTRAVRVRGGHTEGVSSAIDQSRNRALGGRRGGTDIADTIDHRVPGDHRTIARSSRPTHRNRAVVVNRTDVEWGTRHARRRHAVGDNRSPAVAVDVAGHHGECEVRPVGEASQGARGDDQIRGSAGVTNAVTDRVAGHVQTVANRCCP